MSFFTIDKIPLKIVRSDKVKVDPQLNIKSTPLHSNPNEQGYLHLHNAGYNGITFSVSVYFDSRDMLAGNNKATLDEWLKKGSTHSIVTKAIDIPNGEYVITSCTSEQEFDEMVIWNLTFTQYFTSASENLFEKTSDTSSFTSNSSILDNCDLPLTPESTDTEVITVLQQSLKNVGYYLVNNGVFLQCTGVYDENTVLAVTLLQRDYQEEFNLSVTGLFDVATKNCLIQLGG